MREITIKRPTDREWKAMTEEERDRATLSWLIGLKLSTASIRDLEFCRAYLDATGKEVKA